MNEKVNFIEMVMIEGGSLALWLQSGCLKEEYKIGSNRAGYEEVKFA